MEIIFTTSAHFWMLTGLSSFYPLWKKTRRQFIKIIMITWKSSRGNHFYWAVDLLMNFKTTTLACHHPHVLYSCELPRLISFARLLRSKEEAFNDDFLNSFPSLLLVGCFDDFGIVATRGQRRRQSFPRPFRLCKYLLYIVCIVYSYTYAIKWYTIARRHSIAQGLFTYRFACVCRVPSSHLLHIQFSSSGQDTTNRHSIILQPIQKHTHTLICSSDDMGTTSMHFF